MPYKDSARRREQAAAMRAANRDHYNAEMRRCRADRLARDPVRQKAAEAKQFASHYSTPKGRAVHMLNNARARARRLDVECTLDAAWIVTRLEAGVCEVTGLPLDMTAGRGKGHRENSFSPSLERRDPIGPYSPENCVIACWIYNRAKGAFPLEDLMTMARALVAAA